MTRNQQRGQAWWEDRYERRSVESMGWFHPELDHDFSNTLDELDRHSGLVLDLGAGIGTQAVELARRGMTVVASDISQKAVDGARERAGREGVTLELVVDDIVDSKLDQRFARSFDIIFDRGCFHVLDVSQRSTYARQIEHLLADEGLLLLKCFSSREPASHGPKRLTEREIHRVFDRAFVVESVIESHFQGKREPPPLALYCTIRRRGAEAGASR